MSSADQKIGRRGGEWVGCCDSMQEEGVHVESQEGGAFIEHQPGGGVTVLRAGEGEGVSE